MAETHGHGRGMEGGWNQSDWPVECLLNGITSSDNHLMFSPQILHHQFRQRFQSPLQLNGTTSHLVSINSNVSLSTHSIIESNVAVDANGQVNNSAVSSESGQDGLPQNIPDVLDDTDDTSEDDDDMSSTIPQNGNQLSLAHTLNDESLVQCDQVTVVQDPLGHQQISMTNDPHCHHQKLNNVNVQLQHEHEQQHNLQPHTQPINPMFFQEQDQFETHIDEGNDPNTGFSVYGKLYYEREGRVVLHLKQWMEPSSDPNGVGMGFVPSGVAEGLKSHLLQGCALCRLRTPGSQEPYRNQKQGHRHTFRGVLFTFEECMIVELYPEQNNGITSAQNGLKPNESQPKIIQRHPVQPQTMGIQSYMDRPIPSRVEDQIANEQLLEQQRQQQQQHMEMNALGNVQSTQQKPDEHQSAWWDEFESDGGAAVELKDDSSDLSEEECEPPQSQEISVISQLKDNEDSRYPKETSFIPSNDNQESREESRERSGQLDSLMLNTHQPEPIENLATPTNQEGGDDSALNFNIVESNEEIVEDSVTEISTVVVSSSSAPGSTTKGKYGCPCCVKFFPLKKLLKVHLENEHSGNRFHCVKCSLQLTDEKQLSKHSCTLRLQKKRLKKRQEEKESCTSSHQVETQPKEIVQTEVNVSSKNEMEIVLPLKSEKSSLTNSKKSSFSGLKHKRKKCLTLTRPQKKFPCNICGKSFAIQRRFETHRHSHDKEKISCEKCGKQFTRKDKLRRHMFVHSEEKMFSCSICDKRFSRRDKLADHQKSHGGPDEIHHCPMCNKEFLRPDILKQHVKLHGMRNKHQCSECLRFVTGKDRLEQHMARHLEAKAQGQPLLCPLCTKNFIQRQSLKAHIKKFHPSAHSRLLSDLDFPPDLPIGGSTQDDDEEEQNLKVFVNTKFECDLCPYPKYFRKKCALVKHQSKHHNVLPKSSTTKGKKRMNGMHKFDKTNNSPKQKQPISSNPTSPNPPINFTSAASQIVSPPTSPMSPSALSIMEQPIQSHTLLPTLHPRSPPLQHHLTLSQSGHQFHLTATTQPPTAHIPITLALNGTTSPTTQQNGILVGNHTISNHSLHHHALLQQAHNLSPMGQTHQLHPHLSHVSMPHHVAMSAQPPYVIYPHYYQ